MNHDVSYQPLSRSLVCITVMDVSSTVLPISTPKVMVARENIMSSVHIRSSYEKLKPGIAWHHL